MDASKTFEMCVGRKLVGISVLPIEKDDWSRCQVKLTFDPPSEMLLIVNGGIRGMDFTKSGFPYVTFPIALLST